MKTVLSFPAVMTLVVLLIFPSWDAGVAQAPGTKISPEICMGVQKQIDRIVAISESTSLSDDEKIEKLTKSWSESWAAILGSAKQDPQVAAMMKVLGTSMTQLQAQTDAAGRSGEKNVSSTAKAELDKIRQQIKPYMAFMKLMCPNLVTPDVMSK